MNPRTPLRPTQLLLITVLGAIASATLLLVAGPAVEQGGTSESVDSCAQRP